MSDPATRMGYRCQVDSGSDGDVVRVEVLDIITSYPMFPGEVSAHDVIKQLAEAPDAPVVVDINSYGGEVFDALAIHNVLLRRDDVTINILGVAASAATVIAMAGQTINMAANASFMVHLPWSVAIGAAGDMRKEADVLDKIGEQLALTYAARTGQAMDEVMALLEAETWMTAEKALAAGFITDITPASRIAAQARIPAGRFARTPAERIAAPVAHRPPSAKKERVMSKDEPAAALSPVDIRNACPGCDDKFVLDAIEAGKALDDLRTEHMTNQAAALQNRDDSIAALKQVAVEKDAAHASAVEELKADHAAVLAQVRAGIDADDAPAPADDENNKPATWAGLVRLPGDPSNN
ncbi:MAG: head maturation protease, ClpP-related [Planctomycetota bacterium]